MAEDKKLSKKTLNDKNEKTAFSLLLGVFTAFNVGFFIPMDFYLANISGIMLPVKAVMLPLILISIGILAAVFAICVLTKEKAHMICCSLIFGISLAFYIESNYLSLDLGQLDGSQYRMVWQKAVINILMWAPILIFPFVLYKRSKETYKKVISYAAAVITLIEMITVSVSFVQLIINDEGGHIYYTLFDNSSQRVCSTKDLSVYSKDKNVIIILTDEYDSFCFDETLRSAPETTDEFDGFTYYSNTLGAYTFSTASIAYITTGIRKDEDRYPYDNDRFFKNMKENYKSNLYGVIDVFDKNIFEKYSENYIIPETDSVKSLGIVKPFYKITFYKCMPDILKKFFWINMDSFTAVFSESEDMKYFNPDNLSFYENMPTELDTVDEKCFKFIYLYGLHDPRNITADLRRAENWSISPEEEAAAVNKILGKYLGILKKNGVYDNSEIMILADHGLKGHENGKYPLLMYKPAGEVSEGITVSQAPISYDDLYPTLLKMSGDTPEGRTIWDIPEDEVRTRTFYSEDREITGNIKD